MRSWRYRWLAAAVTMAMGAAGAVLPAHASAQSLLDCRTGVYRLSDGGVVDVGPTDGGLRWRRPDGTSGALALVGRGRWRSTLGWTGRPDGKEVSFSDVACDRIRFDGVDGARIPLDVTETRVQAADATLAGRLVMPRGEGAVPIVVLIHGAEHDSALQFFSLQRLLPAAGIGVFVYDKRGTGQSTGDYTQDYLTLATDAVAAMREAKRLAGPRLASIGYHGGSQGGWVAPLAATIEPVDFIIVAFGLAVSPLEEDRSAIALDMTRHGFGPKVVEEAMHVADAVAAVLNSGFQSGYDQVAAVRARYGTEPWFRYVHGNVAWAILEKTPEELRTFGPKAFAGVPLHYDPMPVLRNLATPQLWLLGADDIDAPSAETARRLTRLAADGRPISVVVFPRAEHGLYEYETQPDGTRLSTRQPEMYFARMRDFILSPLHRQAQ